MENNLAVLIDADNIPARYLKAMMEEIAKYGNPTIKRIYGDWTNPRVNQWKSVLLENAINPVQQYAYTTGKNATDSAMIIDAMDILYSHNVNGFCIVSSDSDFTKLATRLRESGKTVYGIGEKKTPEPFIVSCDKFIYLEILKGGQSGNGDKKVKTKQVVDKISNKTTALIKETIGDLADDDGWAFFFFFLSLLQKKQPNFDPRNFGYQKLTPLISSIKGMEVEKRGNSEGKFKLIYVRITSA